MATRVHALDNVGVAGAGVVDHALAQVVAGDEEGSLGVVSIQPVEKMAGVMAGAVVKGDGNVPGIDALVDAGTLVGNRAEFGPLHVRCVGSTGVCHPGTLVGITHGTVVLLAVGGSAVVFARTTPPGRGVCPSVRSTLSCVTPRDLLGSWCYLTLRKSSTCWTRSFPRPRRNDQRHSHSQPGATQPCPCFCCGLLLLGA